MGSQIGQVGENRSKSDMRCSSGKKCFELESLALEALVQNHIINEYPRDEGPINIYECEKCGYWHFTSKGLKHTHLEDPEIQDRIKKERQANYWERKLR